MRAARTGRARRQRADRTRATAEIPATAEVHTMTTQVGTGVSSHPKSPIIWRRRGPVSCNVVDILRSKLTGCSARPPRRPGKPSKRRKMPAAAVATTTEIQIGRRLRLSLLPRSRHPTSVISTTPMIRASAGLVGRARISIAAAMDVHTASARGTTGRSITHSPAHQVANPAATSSALGAQRRHEEKRHGGECDKDTDDCPPTCVIPQNEVHPECDQGGIEEISCQAHGVHGRHPREDQGWKPDDDVVQRWIVRELGARCGRDGRPDKSGGASSRSLRMKREAVR